MAIHSQAWFTLFAAAAALHFSTSARADDCNNNSIDDCTDIDAGMADTDNDDILDSCERAYGDIGLDGSIDGNDLRAMLSAWGNQDPLAGFDGNGVVAAGDLSVLLGHWGPSPFGEGHCSTPAWATLIQFTPDPTVVTDALLRSAIIATGLPWRVVDTATGIEMLLVPPGVFDMGCSASAAAACWSDEFPVHEVALTQAIYVGRTEVTQDQWQAEMGYNPSYYGARPNNPVEMVSWNTIQGFLSRSGMRLPTEAEWEYSCRAGTTTAFYNGSTDDSTLGSLAWYASNACEAAAGCETQMVATRLPNALGLYDMLGNVWEWCHEWHGDYSASSVTDPTGPSSGSSRLWRGGCWLNYSNYCRASSRDFNYPDYASNYIGFRVARTP